jgi:hypothetical protein
MEIRADPTRANWLMSREPCNIANIHSDDYRQSTRFLSDGSRSADDGSNYGIPSIEIPTPLCADVDLLDIPLFECERWVGIQKLFHFGRHATYKTENSHMSMLYMQAKG